jgi:hypothetical protein
MMVHRTPRPKAPVVVVLQTDVRKVLTARETVPAD